MWSEFWAEGSNDLLLSADYTSVNRAQSIDSNFWCQGILLTQSRPADVSAHIFKFSIELLPSHSGYNVSLW